MAPLLEIIDKVVYTHHGTKDHNKLVIMVDFFCLLLLTSGSMNSSSMR